MKVYKVFFVILLFVFLVGCGNNEDILEEKEALVEEEIIEEVSEEEGIDFILSVLGGSEDLSTIPVIIMDGEVIYAEDVQGHIAELDPLGEIDKIDEEVIITVIKRFQFLMGTNKFFNEMGITVTEIEIDEKMEEFIQEDDNIETIEELYEFGLVEKRKSRERTREDFAYMTQRDKMFEKLFEQYAEEVTETELVALYQEKLKGLEGTGLTLMEYGEYRKYLLEEIVQQKIFEGTDHRLGEIIESLEIIYFKE